MKVCPAKLFYLSFFLCVISNVTAQESPKPISHWQLNSQTVQGKKLKAIVGLDGDLTFSPRFAKDSLGQSAVFENESDRCVIASDFNDVKTQLPTSAMTVAAWFSVDTRQPWGGIINVLQDNGNYEKGWYLGYGEETFTFGLATTGADDGDGDLSYFAAKTNYEVGKLYYVVATFDGKLTKIYVNGKLETTETSQHGEILYPKAAPYVIGSYVDDDESYAHHGRIREVKVFAEAVSAAWIQREFEKLAALAAEVANAAERKLELALLP